MQIWLDGTAVDIPAVRSVAELLEGLSPHIDPARTVTAVEVNGRCVDHADPFVAASSRLAEGDSVRVVTETPAEFAAGRRAAIAEYVGAIASRFEAAASGLRGGEISQGNRLLAEAARDLGLLLELDRSLTLLDATETRCAAIVSVLERIGSRLTDAEHAQRWEEVAALLCDELVPAMRTIS